MLSSITYELAHLLSHGAARREIQSERVMIGAALVMVCPTSVSHSPIDVFSLIICPAVSSTPWIVLLSILIANLSSRLATPILSALDEAFIQIRSDQAFVKFGAADVFHAIQRILMSVVLDKAEAAGCLLEAVEAHDEALDLADFGKKLVDLLFGGVEGSASSVNTDLAVEGRVTYRFPT